MIKKLRGIEITSIWERATNTICGLMIVALVLGEHKRIFGIPPYCYLLILAIIMTAITYLSKKNWVVSITLRFRKSYLLQCCCILWITISTMLLPLVLRDVGFEQYYFNTVSPLIAYIICCNANTQEKISRLFAFALIALLINCALSHVELITGNHYVQIRNEYYVRMGEGSTFAFQGNINDNATVFAISIFAALFFLKEKPVLSILTIVWSVYLVFCIGSRMAIYAVLSIALVAIVISVFGKLTQSTGRATKLLIIFLIIGVVVVISSLDHEQILGIISTKEDYNNDKNRIEILQRALEETAKTSFFFGNGPGKTQTMINSSVHSAFIQLLCDDGFLVFALLIAVMVRFVFVLTENRKVSQKIFFVAFAVAFILMSFCSSNMVNIRITWAMLALVWCYYSQKACNKSNPKEMQGCIVNP